MPALTFNQARHEANIAARAARLFTSEGYRYTHLAPGSALYCVLPADKTKIGYIVDVENHTCNCKGHELNAICSHRLAIEQVDYDAQLARRADEYNPIDLLIGQSDN